MVVAPGGGGFPGSCGAGVRSGGALFLWRPVFRGCPGMAEARPRFARPGPGVRGSADGGEHPEVVGGAGEEELAGGVVQAAEAEAAQAGAVLEAGVQSLDVGGASLVCGAALGVRSRCALASTGVAPSGGGPAAGSRPARARALPSAMSRGGPGAVRLASLW